MPTVYLRADPKYRTRFHRDPGCWQLNRSKGNPVVSMELEDVQSRPCLTCYPDAPHLEIHKAYCSVCNSKQACEHNGGILIRDRGGRRWWVWPDQNNLRWYRQTA